MSPAANKSTHRMRGDNMDLDFGHRGTPLLGGLGCSPTTRAERAKLKSCKDDKITAQGKRGTSAALGMRHNMIPSLVSNRVWRGPGAPNPIGNKRDWEQGDVYPGLRPRRPCPGLLSGRPSRG